MEEPLDVSLTVRDMPPCRDDSLLYLSCSTGSSTPRSTNNDNILVTSYSKTEHCLKGTIPARFATANAPFLPVTNEHSLREYKPLQ